MAVPLPRPGSEKLTRPDAAEVDLIARAIATVAAPPAGLTDLQRMMIEALCPALTEHPVDVSHYVPITPDEFAEALRDRTLEFRTRVVQMTVLCALVLRPLPVAVAEHIERFAAALGVEEGMVGVARRFATGSLGLAAMDFERNGYTSHWHPEDARTLHTSHELRSAWEMTVTDAPLAEQWASLESLPSGSLGRGVWEMYQARGFVFPGLPGSAPPLLAQHDWVHVLGDFGTTVESEIEVFALIARANDDMRAFSLLAMVVSLFETGYLRTGAGLFQYDPGHISGPSHGEAMALRLADALRRGAWCHDEATGSDSIDYLQLDWFELAPLPVDEVRRRFCLRPKSAAAQAAGSVGPWEPGGISPFQVNAGRTLAERAGRAYESYGAAVKAGPAGTRGG
jgi:hypothetical protein